jgi:hypothetical protein
MLTTRLYRWVKVSITLVFLVSLVTLLFCDAKPPEQKQRKKPVATQTTTEEVQAEQARKGSWPFNFEKEIGGEVQAESGADKMITRNFVIIFDDSGSMAGRDDDGNRKIDTAKNAVVEWSKSVPAGANVGLVSFHSGVWSLQLLTPASKEQLISAVRNIEDGGSTPLSKAFEKSFFMLTKQGLKQLGYGEYTIVVITDGEANEAVQLNEWVHFVLDNSPIQIYTIGFGIGTDHTLNQPGLTQYRPAENLAELQKGLKEVLAEAETFDETEFK